MVWRGARRGNPRSGEARQGSAGAPSRVAVLQDADQHAQARAGLLGQVFNVDAVAHGNASMTEAHAMPMPALSTPRSRPQVADFARRTAAVVNHRCALTISIRCISPCIYRRALLFRRGLLRSGDRPCRRHNDSSGTADCLARSVMGEMGATWDLRGGRIPHGDETPIPCGNGGTDASFPW